MVRTLSMKPRFVADGAVRLEQSEEFQAKLRALRDSIHEKYAAELSTAGLVRRCVLRWRIAVEYRREKQRMVPSSQALYSSGINWQALSRNNSVAKNTRPHPCPTAIELSAYGSEYDLFDTSLKMIRTIEREFASWDFPIRPDAHRRACLLYTSPSPRD